MADNIINENKYIIDTEENKKFMEQMRNDLFYFGRRFPSPGGGAYYLGDDGTPWKERSRETWITSRMTHVYSLASFRGHEGAKELAAHIQTFFKNKNITQNINIVYNFFIF